MKRIAVWGLLAAGLVFGAVDVDAQGRAQRLSATLEGTNEVPVVSTPASGEFIALINDFDETIQFVLRYSGLQASVAQAHIHLAQPNVNGGIMVWLCGTTALPGPSGTAVCPQSGSVTGTITGKDIQTITPQGIATGDFGELVDALRAGLVYANVHTTSSPAGEIRGQVLPRNTFRR